MSTASRMMKCSRCGHSAPIDTLDFDERVKWLSLQMGTFPMPTEVMMTNLIHALGVEGLDFNEFLVKPAFDEGHVVLPDALEKE